MDRNWIILAVVGSVVWPVIIYIVSTDGLGVVGPLGGDFRSNLSSIIAGWIAVWVISYMFVRVKEKKE